MTISEEQLFEKALGVRARAHAPYSNFLVGAAIEDEHGAVHVGCNVENAAYPLGACAEAGAISAMIAAGGKKIRRIAIVGGHGALEPCTPCGGCRQRIAEFAAPDTEILLRDEKEGVRRFSISDLLPASFALD